jgi:chromosome partitioning protein
MVFTLVNAKGGTAKSTTALMLAAALADRGDTILVDLDEANGTCLDYASGGRLPFPVATAHDFEAQHARSKWAFIVVDAYPRPTDPQLQALASNTRAAAGAFIIPTTPDAAALRVLARFLPHVAPLGVPYRVGLTMVPPRPSREGDRALRDLRAGGVPVMNTAIPRAAAIGRAARAKRLPWSVPGGRRLELVADELAREVLQHAQEA